MICKWCGETLQPGTPVCRRCRREGNPLSDCGGFYDLVPQAREQMPQQPAPVPPVVEEAPVPQPVQPVMPRRKKKNTLPNVLLCLALVMVVILLIQTISLSGKLADANDQIRRLNDQIDSLEEPADGEDQPINGKDQPTNGKDQPLDGEDQPGFQEGTLPETMDPGVITGKAGKDGFQVEFSKENNAYLTENPVEIHCIDDSGTLIATITLEFHTDEEGIRRLRLDTPDNEQDVSIAAVRWEIGREVREESTLTIDWEGKDKLNCTIILSDEAQTCVTLTGIVIE